MKNIFLNSYKHIGTDELNLFYKGDSALEKLLLQKDIFRSKDLFNKFINDNNIPTPYSIVLITIEEIIIVSDIVRSHPIFYRINGGNINITEDINILEKKKISYNAVNIFLQAGFSLGQNTIFHNIYGVQAGEILVINKVTTELKSQRYFEFKPNLKAESKSITEFVFEFDALMLDIINKFVTNTPSDKKLIVPLSGGYDSRVIGNYLRKLNVKNVICYSYGSKGNAQATISEKVAKSCEYDWFFVEYTEEKWNNLHGNGIIEKYIDFSFQGVSIPHFQDFLAVYELKQKNIIKEGDIFIPGHTLDMLSGGHFNNLDLACTDKLTSIKRTSTRHSIVPSSLIQPSYIQALNSIYDTLEIKPVLFQEYINWQERQAKFISNSCRVYEFFGFDFYLPFWHIKLANYFLQLDQSNRKERFIFKSAVRKGILLPKLSAIEFDDELNKKLRKTTIKQKILNKTPLVVRAILARFFRKKNYQGESMNQIYSLQGNTVKDILGSYKSYPTEMHAHIKTLLLRKPYMTNPHVLSSLVAIKRALDKSIQG